MEGNYMRKKKGILQKRVGAIPRVGKGKKKADSEEESKPLEKKEDEEERGLTSSIPKRCKEEKNLRIQ